MTLYACTPEIEAVIRERRRQDAKWGEQNHGPHEWLTILAEEKGEAAKAVLEGDKAGYIKQLSHIAAVAIAAMECATRYPDRGFQSLAKIQLKIKQLKEETMP